MSPSHRRLRLHLGGTTRLALIAYTSLLAWTAAGCEVDARAQDRVVVRATSPAGVPLHPEERAREVSDRLPDGSEVEVLRWSRDHRWLEVRSSAARGWISDRYLAEEGARPAPIDPFSSREACLASLRSRPARDPTRPRIASWNLRWFPDGTSRGSADAQRVDVEWVACILATLRADAVALQEIVLSERGLAAVEQLRARLGQLTGGRWEARFDECPRDGRQHVGWLVDVTRAELVRTAQLDAVNPLGACAGQLRPGLAAYLRFRSGLDLTAIVVHLDSGEAARDHEHRQRSVRALLDAALSEREHDPDVVVVGDFNTMGCRECPVAAEAEIASLDARIAPALVRVAPSVPCSELYRGRGALLDHALASPSLGGGRVEIHGPCASHRCSVPRGARTPMLAALSDHCPLTLELGD